MILKEFCVIMKITRHAELIAEMLPWTVEHTSKVTSVTVQQCNISPVKLGLRQAYKEI